jgi:hypothetical protein
MADAPANDEILAEGKKCCVLCGKLIEQAVLLIVPGEEPVVQQTYFAHPGCLKRVAQPSFSGSANFQTTTAPDCLCADPCLVMSPFRQITTVSPG